MNKTSLLMILLLMPAHSRADNAPPPPPNPFANLPANGSESFTPFDDDFDDGDAGAAPGFAGRGANPGGPSARPAMGAPNNPSNPGANGGSMLAGAGAASRNKNVAPPANCKELVENFDYPDAEILDVAKAIGKLTGRNFIYSAQDIKGRISVVSQTQITVCDAWNAFLTALNVRGFALVPSGKYLRIERMGNAREKQTPIYSSKEAPANDEYITRVIPLRYIDATEFESAFRLWIPREARMQAYAQTNTIIFTDTASHIKRMAELIALLDVAGYQESLVVMPIRNAAAKDIAKLIESILNESRGASNGFSAPRPGMPYSAPGASRTTRGRSGGSTISKIIADDRTNSLIVKANAAGLQEVRALVRRLDSKVAVSEGSGRIHVVGLKFANAEDLAKTLAPIATGGGGANQNRSFPVFGQPVATFQGEIKVAADKTTQSLVITASPQDFASLKKVIDRLDQPRDQVYIEAMLLEMNITRDNNFGVSFFNSANGISLPSQSNNLQNMLQGLPATGFVLGYKSGMSQNVTVGGDSSGNGGTTYKVSTFQGLLELIQGNSDSNVIATPQIVALDNEKASFEVSETVPVPQTTQPNTVGGIAMTSYGSDTAKLLLEVTPQINKGSNFVKLDINQRLENFDSTIVPKEIQGKATGKTTRATTTKVFVQSDDTVVLSGMIRNTVTESVSKVPFLGDIPVLGWLFKNSATKNIKTNLLVFVTPRIIKQYDKFRKILTKKLDERDEFVEETQGSIDAHGREINRLKKGLPDLTVIEPLPQVKPVESSSFQGPAAPERDDSDDNNNPNDQGFYDPYGGVPAGPFDGMNAAPPFVGDQPPMLDQGGVPMAVPTDPNSIPPGGYLQ